MPQSPVAVSRTRLLPSDSVEDQITAEETLGPGAAGQPGDVEVDALRDQAVVARVSARGDLVVDDRALPLELLGRHHVGDVAGHVEAVVARAADDPRGDAKGSALDGEVVVALEAVDLQDLDVRVGDVRPAPKTPWSVTT